MALDGSPSARWLARGSSHIRTQARLLMEEERRAGVAIDKPSEWMIAREEREYALADAIVTISGFAERSFAETVFAEKVFTIPLGVQTEDFQIGPAKIEERRQRIVSDGPLRVLFVGTKSFRKGIVDLIAIANALNGKLKFKIVGSTEPGAGRFLKRFAAGVELCSPVGQLDLAGVFEWADVFIFPTIEDGFAAVLAEAHAAGLPILTTTNCGGPDFIVDGVTGWVMPIRKPEAFVERLQWADAHRPELAEMVRRISTDFKPRTWDEFARDFEEALERSKRAMALGEARSCV